MIRVNLLALIVLLIALTAAACGATLPSDEQIQAEDEWIGENVSSDGSIIVREAFDKVVGYYPADVNFQFVRQVRITEQEVITGPLYRDAFIEQNYHVYDVVFEDRKVSGVAIGAEDGSIWIYNMSDGGSWFYEGFMELPQSAEAADDAREPAIEITGDGSLYFAYLNIIPELSNRNEGVVRWNENEKTLTIGAVKVTGTTTGAPGGPTFQMVITWANGKPELISVEYQPAPVFSQPGQVLYSGEVMDIETDRLIEIAEYFKTLIREKAYSID